MCDRTKFRQNRPDGFGDIAFFWFSRWPQSAILDFEIFRFLVNRQIGCLMCIAIPNFTKIGQTVAEISHLTIFKMEAVCHLRFLKVWVFDQLVSSGGLICAILQNFIRIFFSFLRWSSSAILDFEFFLFIFWFTVILGGLICIVIPKFTEIG